MERHGQHGRMNESNQAANGVLLYAEMPPTPIQLPLWHLNSRMDVSVLSMVGPQGPSSTPALNANLAVLDIDL